MATGPLKKKKIGDGEWPGRAEGMRQISNRLGLSMKKGPQILTNRHIYLPMRVLIKLQILANK